MGSKILVVHVIFLITVIVWRHRLCASTWPYSFIHTLSVCAWVCVCVCVRFNLKKWRNRVHVSELDIAIAFDEMNVGWKYSHIRTKKFSLSELFIMLHCFDPHAAAAAAVCFSTSLGYTNLRVKNWIFKLDYVKWTSRWNNGTEPFLQPLLYEKSVGCEEAAIQFRWHMCFFISFELAPRQKYQCSENSSNDVVKIAISPARKSIEAEKNTNLWHKMNTTYSTLNASWKKETDSILHFEMPQTSVAFRTHSHTHTHTVCTLTLMAATSQPKYNDIIKMKETYIRNLTFQHSIDIPIFHSFETLCTPAISCVIFHIFFFTFKHLNKIDNRVRIMFQNLEIVRDN